MMEAIGSCWFPNESREKNANLILDYYDNHLNNSNLNPFQKFTLTRVFKDFIVAGKHEIANRILSITPQCSFGNFEEVLATQSYRSYKNSRSKEGVLNEDQIEAIINRCKPFTLHTLTEYCKKVHKEAESLKYDVDFNNKYDGQNLNKQEIMNGFYEIHHGIIQKLLNLVTDLENSSSIISALSTLANQGEIQLLEMFLVKYENLLLSEDILSILKKTQTFCEKELALKGFEYLFTKYNQDLDDDQCMELLKQFSDHLLDTTHIRKKMIEIRPDLNQLVA